MCRMLNNSNKSQKFGPYESSISDLQQEGTVREMYRLKKDEEGHTIETIELIIKFVIGNVKWRS